MRLQVGQHAPRFTVVDLSGRPIALSRYAGVSLLLSFHRYAVCPLCDLRLWHLARRAAEYAHLGLYQLVFVESAPDRTHWYLDRVRCPFPVVPDPRGVVYRQYGLGMSVLAVPTGFLRRYADYRQAGRQHLGGWNLGHILTESALFRLPASFIIGPDQRIELAYYGRDTGDFLSFARLDRFLAETRTGVRSSPP
jgi:thioredoxin-dependent peroxiredoxin